MNEQLLLENINDEIRDIEDKIHEKTFGFKSMRGHLKSLKPNATQVEELEKRLRSLKRLRAGLIGGGILAAGGLAYAGKKAYDKKTKEEQK